MATSDFGWVITWANTATWEADRTTAREVAQALVANTKGTTLAGTIVVRPATFAEYNDIDFSREE